MCLASFYYKLYFILPNRYNDPRISQDEWISLNNFLNNLGDDAYKNGTDKNMRGCFLYWSIFVRQKLGESYIDIKLHKMVVNEFTKDDFPMGKGFYNECKNIVDGANNASINSTEYRLAQKLSTDFNIEENRAKPPYDPYFEKEAIGTKWVDNPSTKAILEKTGSNSYLFKWRDSYGVNKIELKFKSKYIEESMFGYKNYKTILEGNFLGETKKIVLEGPVVLIQLRMFDELGKETNQWSLTRE